MLTIAKVLPLPWQGLQYQEDEDWQALVSMLGCLLLMLCGLFGS